MGLFSGGDIEILEFKPPPLVFGFPPEEISFPLYTGWPVDIYVDFGFGCSATLEYAVVLDTKGIREAVQERNPLKALNSFAFRDVIDGKGK